MLNIHDETSSLTDLCMCRGTAVPDCESWRGDHDEYRQFQMLPWDRDRLLSQMDAFIAVLERHGVRMHLLPHSGDHPWQMYTRDVGFVVEDKLFYSATRELPERDGEIEIVRRALDVPMVEIGPQIEGGDVIVDGDTVFVGLGTRSTHEGAMELATHVDKQVVPIFLGREVMHLDCRMNILPGRRLLTYTGDMQPEDVAMLCRRFTLIEMSKAEAMAMGTNCFTINPEVVVMHPGFERAIAEVEATGLHVEWVDYSEPNALLGSFRCSTMPLARAG